MNIVKRADTINTLMRAILYHIESAPDGIPSADLRTKMGLNTHQCNTLVGMLVRSKRIVNEDNVLRRRP
jgi:hypothetical protein